jgi:hypothetical protein
MTDKRLDIIIGARDEATAALNNVRNMLGGIGAAYLSMEGMKKVWDWSIGGAAESEVVFNRLRGQVMALGISYESVESRIKQFTTSLMINSRFSNEAAADSLRTAIIHTNNLASAEQMVTLAANIAARMGEDLTSVIEKLSLGYEGAVR